MESLKLDILKHLKKVGADTQKINIADFLNSKINKDADYFVISSLMNNFLRDKIIDGYADIQQLSIIGKMPAYIYKSYYIRLTPNGEAIIKAYENSKEDNKLKKYNLLISSVSILVAIFFGSLSEYYNSKNQDLQNSIFLKDIQIVKLHDSLNVLKQNLRQIKTQYRDKK